MSTIISIKASFGHSGLDFIGFPLSYNANLNGSMSIKEYTEAIEFINSNSTRFYNGSSTHKQLIKDGIKSAIEQINRNYSDRNIKFTFEVPNNLRETFLTISIPTNQIQPIPMNNTINSSDGYRIIIVTPPHENKSVYYAQTQTNKFDHQDTNLKSVVCFSYSNFDYSSTYRGADKIITITTRTYRKYPTNLYNYVSENEYSDILRGFYECEVDVIGDGYFYVLFGLIFIFLVIGIFLIIIGKIKQKKSRKENVKKHTIEVGNYIKFLNSRYESRGITFGFHKPNPKTFEVYLIAYVPKDYKDLPILTLLEPNEQLIISSSKTGTIEPKFITNNIVNNIISNSTNSNNNNINTPLYQ